MGKILTIDLGTSTFKIAAFDRGGRLRAVCRVAPPVVAPEIGRMELPADGFVDTMVRGINELRDRVDGGLDDIEAVTFATQTNSFVLLDADDRPWTPIILWPDNRASALEAEVQRRCDVPDFTATTGVPRLSSQFSPAKLLWIQQHTPDIWQRARRFCLISDYLTLLLTGRHVTEAGAAGLTGLVDIHRCRWWPEMLARFQIDERLLPAVVRAGTDLGPILPQTADRFGLPRGCRFVVGCLDQYAGAIGVGNVAPGMFSETTGTVLATVCCSDHFGSGLGPAVFQGPAFREGLYWRMTFGDISADYLQWYRDQLPVRPEFAQLGALAERIKPGAEGLRLRTDVARATAALDDVFDGMTSRHTCGHAVRCIMEAVARALGEQIAALSGDAAANEIRCAGGAARSDLWLQIKADMLDIATVPTNCPEPTSLGAAVLAEAALSGNDVRDVAQRWVSLKSSHRPDPKCHQQYLALRQERKSP